VARYGVDVMPLWARRGRACTTALGLVLLLGPLALPSGTVARSGGSDPGPAGLAVPPEEQLIVRYAPGTDATERRAVRARHGLARIATARGGRLELVAAGDRTAAQVRAAVVDDPAIRSIAPNFRREPAVEPLAEPMAEPRLTDLWGLHNRGQTVRGVTGLDDIDIDWPEAMRVTRGDPAVVVAVIDSGIDPAHPDLAGALWTNPGEAGAKASNGIDDDGNGYIDDVQGWDFCNDDASIHDLGEDQHGTHVAGTIAARLDGQGIVGVAPAVRVMALKFLDESVHCGYDWQAVQAIDYAASFGVPIINASWGSPERSTVIEAALRDSGALVVAAAGNQGIDLDAGDTRYYPAASTLETVLAVGAMDQRGGRASFSNYGRTSVDIAAPGVRILSTQPASASCPAPCYAWASGTSMAAPHVSGAAALLASVAPRFRDDPVALRRRLLERGQLLPSGTAWLRTGRGVNAKRALDSIGPVAAAPNRFQIAKGTRIGSTTPLVVSWPAARDALTGVRAYRLRRIGPSGSAVVEPALAATSASASVALRASYRFVVAGIDGVGNVGAEVSGPTIVASHHNEASSLARYSRGWRRVSSSAALGGTVMTTTTPGAVTRFTFTGRSVALVLTRAPGHGAVRIYLDGTYQRTVDLDRSARLSRTVVYTEAWDTTGTHEVRLVTVDRGRVDVDGWVVVR
jgi:subtilisin family serine protease